MKEKARLKRLFSKVQKQAKEMSETKREFDQLIEDNWKYHYSDVDLDWIIDTLDYGIGGCSFEEFLNLMNENCSPKFNQP